jgi:hypothetical protein
MARKTIDREKLKQSWADIHPGLPQHDRVPMMLERLIDALCDELER